MKLLRKLFSTRAALRGPAELVAIRLGFALILYLNLPDSPAQWTSQPHPHGIGQWLDLTFAADPGWFAMARIISIISLILYGVGFGILLPLGAILCIQICISSLNLSQGVPGHSGQVLMLTVLGHWLIAAWSCVKHPRDWRTWLAPRWPVQAASVEGGRQAILAAYFVAGVTKIINSGGEWLERSGNFVLQMTKTMDETWFTEGLKPTPIKLWFQDFLLHNPLGSGLFLSGGLLLELAAPLALLNRKLSLLVGLGLLAFHQLNGLLMELPFTLNQRLIVVFLVFAGLPFDRYGQGQPTLDQGDSAKNH